MTYTFIIHKNLVLIKIQVFSPHKLTRCYSHFMIFFLSKFYFIIIKSKNKKLIDFKFIINENYINLNTNSLKPKEKHY